MSSFRMLASAVLVAGVFASTAAFSQESDEVDLLAVPGQVVEDVTAGVADTLGLSDNEDGIAACARRFRSFDAQSGTYLTYSGERVLCPYLRG